MDNSSGVKNFNYSERGARIKNVNNYQLENYPLQ